MFFSFISKSNHSSEDARSVQSSDVPMPNNLNRLVSQGQSLAKQGSYEESLDYFDEVLTLSPTHQRALSCRALTYINLGRNRSALADLNRLIDIAPRNLWAYANRAIVFRELGQYGRAVADFSHLVTHDSSKRWQWLVSRGSTLTLMGRHKQALQDFDLSLQLKPNNRWATEARSEVLMRA